MEVPLLPDTEAAVSILRDAEATDEQVKAILKDVYAQWRAGNEEVKKALALPAQG